MKNISGKTGGLIPTVSWFHSLHEMIYFDEAINQTSRSNEKKWTVLAV
jgi:hypothetical protein